MEDNLIAIGAGYSFNLYRPEDIIGVELKGSGQIVVVKGKEYEVHTGKTFEDSQKIDSLLDKRGELLVKDYLNK